MIHAFAILKLASMKVMCYNEESLNFKSIENLLIAWRKTLQRRSCIMGQCVFLDFHTKKLQLRFHKRLRSKYGLKLFLSKNAQIICNLPRSLLLENYSKAHGRLFQIPKEMGNQLSLMTGYRAKSDLSGWCYWNGKKLHPNMQ